VDRFLRGLGHGEGPHPVVGLVVDAIIPSLLHAAGDLESLPQGGLHVFRGLRPGDDEGRPGLVHQHAVRFIDDGIMQAPEQESAVFPPPVVEVLGVQPIRIHSVAQGDPVPEVIEDDLLVGAVDDVAAVGAAPLGRSLVVDDAVDREAQEAVHLPHPLRVPGGEIIIDRDHVDGKARHGYRGGRQGRDEGLALPRVHLGEKSLEQSIAAGHLAVEGAHSQDSRIGLADQRKRLRDEVVLEALPPEPHLQGLGPLPELPVRPAPHRLVVPADPLRDLL
jgi:hypothetical protein